MENEKKSIECFVLDIEGSIDGLDSVFFVRDPCEGIMRSKDRVERKVKDRLLHLQQIHPRHDHFLLRKGVSRRIRFG